MKKLGLTAALTVLMMVTLLDRSTAAGAFMSDASYSNLHNALSRANNLKQLSQYSCDVIDQDSTRDTGFCGESGPPFRCFADVRYENGGEIRVWGQKCYSQFSDCWWNGSGSINPCH